MKQIEQILRLNYTTKDFLRLMASTKCKIALVETALCLAHTDDQMLGNLPDESLKHKTMVRQ